MDLGIFQETKFTDGIYTRDSVWYSVNATDAPIRHHRKVAVFYCPAPHFAVEAVHKFRPNVVGFHMSMGEQRWYIVGCYLAPKYTLTIESVVAAPKEQPRVPNCSWRETLTKRFRSQRDIGGGSK